MRSVGSLIMLLAPTIVAVGPASSEPTHFRASAQSLFAALWMETVSDWDGDIAFGDPKPHGPGWAAPEFPAAAFLDATADLSLLDCRLPTVNELLIELQSDGNTWGFMCLLSTCALVGLGRYAHTFGKLLHTALAMVRRAPRRTMVAGVQFYARDDYPTYVALPDVGQQAISAGLPRQPMLTSAAAATKLGPAIALSTAALERLFTIDCEAFVDALGCVHVLRVDALETVPLNGSREVVASHALSPGDVITDRACVLSDEPAMVDLLGSTDERVESLLQHGSAWVIVAVGAAPESAEQLVMAGVPTISVRCQQRLPIRALRHVLAI